MAGLTPFPAFLQILGESSSLDVEGEAAGLARGTLSLSSQYLLCTLKWQLEDCEGRNRGRQAAADLAGEIPGG